MHNPRYLNAEDDDTLATPRRRSISRSSIRISEICVLRGDTVEHPKYRGRTMFSAGINLTHLYHGKIPYLWYITREMGVVNKMMRGAARPDAVSPDEIYGGTSEKPWVAGVDAFAIGGGCQYLLAMDYVVGGERRLHDAAGAQGGHHSGRRQYAACRASSATASRARRS